MSKTNEQLLLDYKKSNKERRKAILEKAGFVSEQKYISWLLGSEEDEVATDMLDQVIAFDTTGSMGGFITAVKQHIKELIPKLFAENPSLRLKIVAFGDYADMPNATTFGNAYQDSGLSNDANQLISFVERAQNTGGDDADEFYELVIKKVVEETPWREGSKRALLLIGDCGPHQVGYTCAGKVTGAQIDWKEEAGKAVGLGIQIDTLNCGSGCVETFYKPLSFMTDGINLPFSSQSKTQEAIYAVTSVRGSSTSKMAFMTSSMSDSVRGDAELSATYDALYKKLVD